MTVEATSEAPQPKGQGEARKAEDLSAPELFSNQELGRLDFHYRVLEQVVDERHPLLERVKFLSLFGDGVDEFFSIRVSGLKEQIESGIMQAGADGLTPQQQLDDVRVRVLSLFRTASRMLYDTLSPALAHAGIRIIDRDEVKPRSHAVLDDYFEREVFPVLTPLAVDPGHPFPHISNFSLNLAVILKDAKGQEHFARIKVPDVLPRLIPLTGLKVVGKSTARAQTGRRERHTFVWLDQLIAANLGSLFPGMDVAASYPFRVIRDADFEIQADEADDLSISVERGLRQRRFGEPVQLTIEPGMPERVRSLLMTNLKLGPDDVYAVRGPLGLGGLMELYRIDRPDLKDSSFVPRIPPALRSEEDPFKSLKDHDVLLHHPFDSFSTVVELLNSAARDTGVLAIKQTLYRVGEHAPVVDALLDAAQHGKQVAVLVELTARGDERSNIDWAREMERAGVHVAYGLVGLKTHAKVALIVRREGDGIRRYVHLGTGNYNASTARTYEDYGLLTSREDLVNDASQLFNYLTGYSGQTEYRAMLVAPVGLRGSLVDLIRAEVSHHLKHHHGHIAIKVNSITDEHMIRELYRASQAGVKVDLLVRGSCSLRPGIPAVSETITVRGLVGRILEHSRVYQFKRGGDWVTYMGSADLMPRNLDRRVEVLFPIEDEELRAKVRTDFELQWSDNVNSWALLSDGTYERVSPARGQQRIDSQALSIPTTTGPAGG
jgi:polyphosphate kinase